MSEKLSKDVYSDCELERILEFEEILNANIEIKKKILYKLSYIMYSGASTMNKDLKDVFLSAVLSENFNYDDNRDKGVCVYSSLSDFLDVLGELDPYEKREGQQ